jgi:hypothetical protein
MEQEIHNLLVELFKRNSNKRNFFIKQYFDGNEYTYSDIEQDFYLKMYNDLLKDYSKINKIQDLSDLSYFAACMKNFIIDYLRKNKSETKILTLKDDELFENLITKHVHSEVEPSSELTINLTDLMDACQFNDTDLELIKQHFNKNVGFVVLNQVFNHTNIQQKIARLIKRLQKELTQIQNQNIDFDILIINDLT